MGTTTPTPAPVISGPQFETQVFPLLSALAMRNDLREEFLAGDDTHLAMFDPNVRDACRDIVNQSSNSFLGVYGCLVRIQTRFSDDAYVPDDCPKNETIAAVVNALKTV